MTLKRAGKQDGNAIVEFALVLPLLVSLFLGTWQFGYAYYMYGELEQAVRAGARYASLRAYDAANATDFQNAVKNVVLYGQPTAGTTTVVPGLAASNVSVNLTFSGAFPSAVAVSISNYKLPGVFGNITLPDKPAVQFPFLGNYAPL
jgi:Flp pilus assembly protein TadG